MADITDIESKDDFVRTIVSNEDLSLSDGGADELWRLWSFRYDNGADDDVLVALPRWFAQDEFDKNRPFLFAKIEHDDPDSGAVLFSDARMIDLNIIENQIWDDVTITETLTVIDERDEYIDEKGKVWIPRSLMTIYRRTDGDDGESSGETSMMDAAGPINDD